METILDLVEIKVSGVGEIIRKGAKQEVAKESDVKVDTPRPKEMGF